MQTAPKRSQAMHTPADSNTLTSCPRYLSRDRERDQRCGRALRAAGEPKRGRVWTRPKRTWRLFRSQSIGVGETEKERASAGGEQRRVVGERSQSPEQEGKVTQGMKLRRKPRRDLGEGPCTVPSLSTHSGLWMPASVPLAPKAPTREAARAVWYLRMVCVIDVWRCSTGRRGS